MTRALDELQVLRDQWRWRGAERPPFAQVPRPGEESVWDYPRPPRIEADHREVIIHFGDREIARTRRALRILETAHPPSFYLPFEDVLMQFLEPCSGASHCEWKGAARYWSLVDGERRLNHVAWSYPKPLPGAERLAKCMAFYPASLRCTVGGAAVVPQAGGFYGGWITPELVGPFKGSPGSQGW